MESRNDQQSLEPNISGPLAELLGFHREAECVEMASKRGIAPSLDHQQQQLVSYIKTGAYGMPERLVFRASVDAAFMIVRNGCSKSVQNECSRSPEYAVMWNLRWRRPCHNQFVSCNLA